MNVKNNAKRLMEISEQLGIEDLLEKYPSEISGDKTTDSYSPCVDSTT